MPARQQDRRLDVLLRQLTSSQLPPKANTPPTSTIIVMGGAVLDIQAQPDGPDDLRRGSSVPGKVQQVPGGVGRNIAEALSRLVQHPLPPPMLASLLGRDAAGTFLLTALQSLRLDLSLVAVKEDMATPCVLAALDKSGEVAACVADVASLELQLTPHLVAQLLLTPHPASPSRPAPHPPTSPTGPIHSAALLVVEANLSEAAIVAACEAAVAAQVPVFMEPVSTPKSTRCVPALRHLTFIKPNTAELRAIAQAVLREAGQSEGKGPSPAAAQPGGLLLERSGGPLPDDALMQQVQHAAVLLEAGVKYVVLTRGALGAALLCMESTAPGPADAASAGKGHQGSLPQGSLPTASQHARHPGSCSQLKVQLAAAQTGLPAAAAGGRVKVCMAAMEALPAQVVNLSGAGDTLVAGMAAALLQQRSPVEALAYGMAAAQLAVQSHSNVPPGMMFDSLHKGATTALSTLQQFTISVPTTLQ